MLFRSNDTATTEIYTRPSTLSLHDALPISLSLRDTSLLFGAIGVLWADVSWKERFGGLYPFARLLLIPLLFAQFKDSDRWRWVERGIELLHPRGLLGAITSRTGFFLSSFQKWREEVLLREALPTVFADLGYGVLDTAMVETAAYCLVKSQGGR